MPSVARVSRIKQNETDIAVLQFHTEALSEKIDDLKTELQELRAHMSTCSQTTHRLIEEMSKTDQEQHRTLERKVTNLEKWRWMIMGAGMALGAIGFEALSKLFALT
jgi:FtsZ-binding cell division protein ZapB